MKEKELEQLAKTLFNFLTEAGLSDGHSKLYDPLTIEKTKEGYMLHSYVFDAEDSGRHRLKPNLKEAEIWLWKSFREWVDRNIEELEFLAKEKPSKK